MPDLTGQQYSFTLDEHDLAQLRPPLRARIAELKKQAIRQADTNKRAELEITHDECRLLLHRLNDPVEYAQRRPRRSELYPDDTNPARPG